MMKKMDYEKWPRKEIYEFFRPLSMPFYNVCFQMDVTALYDFVKRNAIPFYPAMIWACDEALNSIEAFRYSMKDGELILYEKRHPSFTDLKKGSEIFHIVTMRHIEDIREFCLEAKRRSNVQEKFIDMEQESDDLIYYSCLPWLDITSLSNEHDLRKESLDDSVPRIAWGKIRDEGQRKTLTLSVEVNHRFIDGYHISEFARKLGECMDSLDTVSL